MSLQGRIRLFKKIDTNLRNPKFILFTLISIYSVIFSYFTITKYYNFQTYAYDLGVYNQALHNIYYQGNFFYNTADIIANPTGSIFGIHFSPIFFLLFPLYMIYPHPPTLLVIQSCIIAVGAIPVFLIASKRLGDGYGLLFSFLYLLNPALQGVNWYDFHPEALLPTLLLFSLYFYEAEKTLLYFSSIVLALMCIEFSPFVLVFMSIFFLIKLRVWRKKPADFWRVNMAIATIVLSIIWFFFSIQIIQMLNPLARPLTGEVIWGEVGADSILDVPRQAITHPERIIQALSFDAIPKGTYFIMLLGFAGFLPIFEPLLIICYLPWLIPVFLSNFPPFYHIGNQYPAYILPFIFYASILGLDKIKSPLKIVNENKRRIMGCLLVYSALVFPFFTPLNDAPYLSLGWFPYGIPSISQHSEDVLTLLEYIPENASVLTSNDIFPLVSNRPNAYVFPASVLYTKGSSFTGVLEDFVAKSDYLVLDYRTDVIVSPILIHQALTQGEFGVLAAADGAVVLKRGYSEDPIYFQPFEELYDYSSFILIDGVMVTDSESESSYSILCPAETTPTDSAWVGPYVILPPGDYVASFRLKTDALSDEELLALYVSDNVYNITYSYKGDDSVGRHLSFEIVNTGEKNLLAWRRLFSTNFSSPNDYHEFFVTFTAIDFGAYEFRGKIITSNANIYLDRVKITQIKPSTQILLKMSEQG